MFSHDPRLPLVELFQHKLRYLGTDETILSLQALRNMYLVIAENLRKAREKSTTATTKKTTPIQPNQLVTLKVHVRKALDPRYEGTYRVLWIKGNQVEIACNGTVTPTKWAHISHLKPLLWADEVIYQRRMLLPIKLNLPSMLTKFLIYNGKEKLNLTPQLHNKPLCTISNSTKHS